MRTCPACGEENADKAKFCAECATPLGVRGDRAERKQVTALFCDVVGSTTLGETHDPEVLGPVLRAYFEEARGAVERHGGRVEKFIGDAVAAVFGMPTAHEDDALRAVRAAAEIHERVRARTADASVPITCRIGVNTGEALASGDDLPLVGDVMNTAARLQGAAPPDGVLLGELTFHLVSHAAEAEAVEPLELKGKTEPVPAWLLLGLLDVTAPIPRRLDSPIVGREEQLHALEEAFDRVASSSTCRLVTVVAPAGVGKTRLSEEFLSRLGGRATVLRGRCLSYGEGITYVPIVEAIRQAAGASALDPAETIQAAVASIVEGDEQRDIVSRHLAQLLGVGEGAAGDETNWAIMRFFEAVARRGPLVLVLDDIHWAEPTLLDLIEHIADRSSEAPILLLCLARPELLDVSPTWSQGRPNASSLTLEPLSDEAVATLVVNLLGSEELDVDLAVGVADRMVAAAEGNPLYVEQMTAMLVDDGILVHEGDRWIATGGLWAVTVPPTIRALLASRLDRLERSERLALEAASVVGKRFHTGAVRELVPPEHRPRIPGELATLVRRELLVPESSTPPGEQAYRFHHQLVRDVTYDAILKSERAELHEGVADWLERVAGDGLGEDEAIVGYHLEQAFTYRTELGPRTPRVEALGARASSRLTSAGHRARALGDEAAAANLLRRAVATCPEADAAGRARILYELSGALVFMADATGADAVLAEAVELAERGGDRSLELLVKIQRGAVTTLVDPRSISTAERRAQLESAVGAFEALADHAALAFVWTELAQLEWSPMRFEVAEHASRMAAEHARLAGDAKHRVVALLNLISAQYFGVATVEEALRTLDELDADIAGSLVLRSWASMVRGSYAQMLGDPDEARRLIELGGELASDGGIRFLMSAYHQFRGAMVGGAGDGDEASREALAAFDIGVEGGDEGHASTSAVELGRSLLALGRLEEAERMAAEAGRMSSDDDLATQVGELQLRALIHSARAEHLEAERVVRDALRRLIDAGTQAPVFHAATLMDLAQVLREAGKTTDAADAAHEALAMLERKGDLAGAADVRAFVASL